MKFTALHLTDAASAASAAGGQSLRLPPLHLGLRLPPRSALHLRVRTVSAEALCFKLFEAALPPRPNAQRVDLTA